MKNFTEKINKFMQWMDRSGGEGNDPIYRIPTLRLFREYQMEADEVIEDLTEEEREYLQVKQENLVFSLAQRNLIKPEIAKLNLANDFGWSERARQKEEGPVDYVVFNTEGLETEPTANHADESLENEAIKNNA